VNEYEIQLKALKIKLIRIELKVILEEHYYYIRNILKFGSCK